MTDDDKLPGVQDIVTVCIGVPLVTAMLLAWAGIVAFFMPLLSRFLDWCLAGGKEFWG